MPATNADIAAFLATGSATVNLAAPQTVQVIGFDATAQPYTFTGAALTTAAIGRVVTRERDYC